MKHLMLDGVVLAVIDDATAEHLGIIAGNGLGRLDAAVEFELHPPDREPPIWPDDQNVTRMMVERSHPVKVRIALAFPNNRRGVASR